MIRETWDYADATERDAVWIKTSQDAGSASYTFTSDGLVVNGATGGTDGYLGIGVTWGGGLGGGGGFAKHTRTFGGFAPNATVDDSVSLNRCANTRFAANIGVK